jgi:hypothetical protein
MKTWKHCIFWGILAILTVIVALIACDDGKDTAHTHQWGNWIVTKEPTVMEEGEETRICSGCEEIETHSIPKLLPSYNSVTINLPTDKVETILGKNGDIILYGSGVQFTASVNGNNNPLQTVTWTILENVNTGTSLINGVLTIGTADHGKTLSIKATSTADTSKSDTKTIKVVLILPSDFFHKWGTSDNNFTITKDKLINSGGEFDIVDWEAVINADASYKDTYPLGYNAFIPHYDMESQFLLSTNKQKLMWLNIGGGSPSFHDKVEM